MSLTEIKALLKLLRGFKPPAVALMREVRDTIAKVDRRIEHLGEIKQLLRNVLENPLAPEHGVERVY